MTEVAKHNTVADCWMVIDDKIYDVSNFFPEVAPNSQNTSATDATLNKCGYNGTFNATNDGNELTKRAGCSMTNDPLSHMGWSQVTTSDSDTSGTYQSNSKNYHYVLWKGNSRDNKARRVTGATYCGTDITDVFHGVTPFVVAAYTDNTSDLTTGQKGTTIGVSGFADGKKTYQFDHRNPAATCTAGTNPLTNAAVTSCPFNHSTQEYPGLVTILLAKFYKAPVAK
jgi:hypothetical protein